MTIHYMYVNSILWKRILPHYEVTLIKSILSGELIQNQKEKEISRVQSLQKCKREKIAWQRFAAK